MDTYLVNKIAQADGYHEVHKEGCSYLPSPSNRHYLGQHYSCTSAVATAKLIYLKSDGCYYCCNACHTR